MMTKPIPIPWRAPAATESEFEAFYRLELPRVYNFFRYRVGNDQVAEDLTSETFEKAWRNRQRYRRDLAAFSTWLLTIARRVAIDHYRRARRQVPLDALAGLPTDENIEALAQEQNDFARLSAALATLSDRERELVALRYGVGLGNQEIAALTGLSESNVGVILHRVVKNLRLQLEEQA